MQSTERQTAETSFRPSEAAEKYLEQYGDPIVTNTYLKLTILILAAVSLVTLSLFYRAQMALSTIKPMNPAPMKTTSGFGLTLAS